MRGYVQFMCTRERNTLADGETCCISRSLIYLECYNFLVCNNRRVATLCSLTGQIGKVLGDEDSPSACRAGWFDNPGSIRARHSLANSFSLCHTAAVDWERKRRRYTRSSYTPKALGEIRQALGTTSRGYSQYSVSLFIDKMDAFPCPFIIQLIGFNHKSCNQRPHQTVVWSRGVASKMRGICTES